MTRKKFGPYTFETSKRMIPGGQCTAGQEIWPARKKTDALSFLKIAVNRFTDFENHGLLSLSSV